MTVQQFASFPDATNESIGKFLDKHRVTLSQMGDGIPRTKEGFVDLAAISAQFSSSNSSTSSSSDDDDEYMSNVTHFYLVSVSVMGLYVLYRFMFPKR